MKRKFFSLIEWASSKDRPRWAQMLFVAVPLIFIGTFTIGGHNWLLDLIAQAGAAVGASGLFYIVYRFTAYERIHEIYEDDKKRGDLYRIAILVCYAIIFHATFS